MGVKYSAADSAQLIQAMTGNLQAANQVTDRLSSGCLKVAGHRLDKLC